MDIRKVKAPEDADADGMIVTLFLCRLRVVRGWYVGPISKLRDGAKVPYAAPSLQLFGMVAILRAYKLAQELGLSICIVDPKDLWSQMVDLRSAS